MMDARRTFILALALAATGGVSLAADQDSEPEETARSGGQQPVQTADADQAARYGVIRRAATAQDRLDDRAAEFVDRMITAETGAAPGLARRAQVTAGGLGVYAVPARGWICLYAAQDGGEEGGATCNRTAEALRGFLVLVGSPAPGVTRVVGLVPDGVDEVRLRSRGGAVERVPAVGNSFVFETAREPAQIEWGDAVVPVGPAG